MAELSLTLQAPKPAARLELHSHSLVAQEEVPTVETVEAAERSAVEMLVGDMSTEESAAMV